MAPAQHTSDVAARRRSLCAVAGADGSLVPRGEPGAVLHDESAVVARALEMVREQAVTAIVVLAEGSAVTPDDLRRHCAEFLAGFKVPKRVELASALPRTPSGKLMRRALR